MFDQKTYHKQWREKNKHRIAFYNKRWNASDAAKQLKDKYQKSEEGKSKRRINRKIYDLKHPNKIRARQKAKFIKSESCSRCGNPDAEKHHPDYDKPLDVIFLCSKCHTKEHQEQKELVFG